MALRSARLPKGTAKPKAKTPREWAALRIRYSCRIGKERLEAGDMQQALYSLLSAVEEIPNLIGEM